MISFYKALSIVGTIIVLGALQNPADARADVLTLRADEWCPYNCAPGSEKPGYMLDIATEIAKLYGHTIDYKQLSWARAIEETRDGKYVGIIAAAQSDAEGFVFPDQSFGVSTLVYATRKDNDFVYNGIKSLDGKSIGVVQDYTYAEELNDYIKKYSKDIKKVQVAAGDNALDTNIRKLEAGRVDVIVEDLNVLLQKLNQLGKSDVFKISPSTEKLDLYFGFSPKNPKSPEYAKQFSDGLKKLRKSGKINEIMEKYGLKDWQGNQ